MARSRRRCRISRHRPRKEPPREAPCFWLLLGLVSVAAAAIGYRYFPQAFSIVALDITMDRDHALAQAREIVARDRLGPAPAPAGGLVRAGRRDADVRRAGRRRQGGVHADDAGRALRRLHLAGPALRRRADQRDDDPVHAGRPPVRIRRAARRDGARARRSSPAPARTDRRGRGARAAGRSTWRASRSSSRARSAARRPRRPHLHLRARRRRRSTRAATGCSWWCRATG